MPLGGTAVGTGINAHPRFAKNFAKELSLLICGKCKATSSAVYYTHLRAH